MPYVRWAGRPAVLLERPKYAFAVLEPGGGWTKVDTELIRFGEAHGKHTRTSAVASSGGC